MKVWRALLILLITLVFLFPKYSLAHPGRTASDGCHYCRTNCVKWGEVSGARHCHGGYTAPAPAYVAPITKPTERPTIKPTPTPNPKPTLSPSPTPTSEVKGEQTSKPTPSPASQTSTTSSSGSATGKFLRRAGMTLLAYLIYKNRRDKRLEKKGGEKE